MRDDSPARLDGWFKSSFSKDANSCVEVRFADDMVYVRDSKYDGPTDVQPVIAVPRADWAEFLAAVTRGVAVAGSSLGVPAIEHDQDTGNTIVRDAVGTELVYTAREWHAFTAGVLAAEFTQG
jgi:hypothetical protein